MVPIQSIHDKKPEEKLVSLFTAAIPIHYQYMLQEHKYLRMFKNYQDIYHSITFHYAPFSSEEKNSLQFVPHTNDTKFKNIIGCPYFEKKGNRKFHQSSHLVFCDLGAASGDGGISSLSRLIFDFFCSQVTSKKRVSGG